MNYRMTDIAFFVIIVSLVALLVVGTEGIGSGHTVFANRAFSGHETFTNKGINVQTETNQDQGCEGAGGTSGITNACTVTSGRGPSETSTQTQVTLILDECNVRGPPINCSLQACNNIGCQSITCTGTNLFTNLGDCTTLPAPGVLLTSCAVPNPTQTFITCNSGTETHTVPGTGITQSGGVSGEGG